MLEEAAAVGGSVATPVAPRLSPSDTVSQFLGCLAAAQAPADIAALVLTQMVAAILARTFPAAVSVRHPNGRNSV